MDLAKKWLTSNNWKSLDDHGVSPPSGLQLFALPRLCRSAGCAAAGYDSPRHTQTLSNCFWNCLGIPEMLVQSIATWGGLPTTIVSFRWKLWQETLTEAWQRWWCCRTSLVFQYPQSPLQLLEPTILHVRESYSMSQPHPWCPCTSANYTAGKIREASGMSCSQRCSPVSKTAGER